MSGVDTAHHGDRTPLQDVLAISVESAAELLGISRSSAYELFALADLPTLHLRRRVVFPRHALMALVESAERYGRRAEERRVGKEGSSPCRSRWSQIN